MISTSAPLRPPYKAWFCLLAFVVVTATPKAFGERIISEGDTWRYLVGTSFPGSTWNTNGFDDSSWPTGPSGFGYGDGDDATAVPNGTTNVFTRKTFNISDPAAVTNLSLAMDHDDGFVAYINGIEVARSNMPAGVPSNTTFATNHEASRGDGGSNPQEKQFFALSTNVLMAGSNVIAVTVHNASAGSSDLSLITELYAGVTLVRGPFIQMPNSNQVAVVWRTDALTDSAVDYSLDLSYSSTVSDATLTREHVVHIPGLIAGTNYYYRIRSGGVTLWEGDALRTKRADSQPFRFVVVGDFGAGTAGMSNVATRVNAVTDADLFLTVGDNIYNDGQPGLFDPYWFSQYAATMRRAPCMPALGNHDVAGGSYSGAAYLNNFYLPTNGPAGQIERNYSFDYGNAHFAVVDSNPYAEGTTALFGSIKTWLSNDLAGTTKPWKIVYFHHPPYTSSGGSAHADETAVKTNIMPIVEAAGVQFVFDGHNHFYERQNAINGVYHVVTGAGGQSLYVPSNRKVYSAVLNALTNSFSIVDIDGTRLKLRQVDRNGVQFDEFNLDLSHPFKINGLLDNPSWLRADNGLKLYAAIRGHYLYVATQDAGEGGDNFIYVNNILTTNRAANWAKAGQVMQWDCFLADENINAFQGWYRSPESLDREFPYFQSMTSGLNNNGSTSNGVLEGTIDLTNRFGIFPQQIYLAAAAFGNADGGSLTAQAPAGNGDGNVQSNEFLALNTRDISLDLPVADAGGVQTNEAGMTIVLDGSASTAPSGLPLSFNWTQLTGPPVTLINSNSVLANFTLASNVNATLTFQLVVNDTRFDSNAVTTITLYPMVDSDGDGLSDQEESTGLDNVLTPANPNGQITNPNNPDTDGDGASDGQEALAGADPNDSSSLFRIIRISPAGGGGFEIEWTCVPTKTYRMQYRNDVVDQWSDLPGDITVTTTTTNATDSTTSGQPTRFYRIIIP